MAYTKFMLVTGNKVTFLFFLGRKKFFLLVVGDRGALATSLIDCLKAFCYQMSHQKIRDKCWWGEKDALSLHKCYKKRRQEHEKNLR